jgi:hypothetical protein
VTLTRAPEEPAPVLAETTDRNGRRRKMTHSFYESKWAEQSKAINSGVPGERSSRPGPNELHDTAQMWEALGNVAEDMWALTKIADCRLGNCITSGGPADEITGEIAGLNRSVRRAYGSLAFHAEQQAKQLRRKADEAAQ